MIKEKFFIAVILILSFSSWSCHFRSDSEIAAEADREISKSAALQNLEKMCINLPVFSRVGFSKKAIGKGGNMLSYKYRLEQDFNQIKEVYKSKFLSEGWALVREKRAVADDLIEFKKGDLSIFVSNGLYGDENYSVSCQDESIK